MNNFPNLQGAEVRKRQAEQDNVSRPPPSSGSSPRRRPPQSGSGNFLDNFDGSDFMNFFDDFSGMGDFDSSFEFGASPPPPPQGSVSIQKFTTVTHLVFMIGYCLWV